MGPEILSLIGGFPFLLGPLERSSTVHDSLAKKKPRYSFSAFIQKKSMNDAIGLDLEIAMI